MGGIKSGVVCFNESDIRPTLLMLSDSFVTYVVLGKKTTPLKAQMK